MLGYVTIGTSDLARASAFYDAIAAEMNCRRIMDNDAFIAWGPADGGPGLAVAAPPDGHPPHGGNGIVVALLADDREQVDRVHALALRLGAADMGAPGERFTGFYVGEFRDPDGNHLNAFTMG